MKTIWIVNYYSNTPGKINNPRHYEFAKYLTNSGYYVRVFFADRRRMPQEDAVIPQGEKYVNKEYEGLKYTHIAAMPYVGNGIKRGVSIWKFAWRIFRLRKNFEKPDVILLNIHAPFDYPIVWCAKHLKAKFIAEAWDLWPDAFVRFGLMKAKSPVVKFFYRVEKAMYTKADKIIFTFEGGIDYLKAKEWLKGFGGKIDPAKVSYINNGVNLSLFKQYRRDYPTSDVDLLRDDIVKVVYIGSIRHVNRVRDLVQAAEILKDNNNIKFIIIGDGPDRPVLEQYCKDRGLENVLFKQRRVPFCEVADIVSHASINIMNYQKNFGRYGISSGKFFQYLAAGQPICCNVKFNYCEITRHNLGIADNLDTPQKYAASILELSKLSLPELNAMRERVRQVVRKFDLPKLSAELVNVIESL